MAASFASVPELVKKLFCSLPGRDLRQLFRQRDNRFVGKQRGSVLQLVDLRLDLRRDLRIAVAHADGHDPAEEIEVLVALDIPQVLHRAVVGHQRMLVIVRHRRPQKLLVLADHFFAAARHSLVPQAPSTASRVTQCPNLFVVIYRGPSQFNLAVCNPAIERGRQSPAKNIGEHCACSRIIAPCRSREHCRHLVALMHPDFSGLHYS